MSVVDHLPRVVVVTETFSPGTDPATETARRVTDRLIDTGHPVLVVAGAPGLADYRGARVARVRTRTQVGSQVRAELLGFAPDLVLVADPGTVGQKALKHAARLDLTTLTVDGTTTGEFAPDSWRRKVAERSDALLVTSTWMRERLLDQGIPVARWSPGVDTDAFHPGMRSEELRDRWLAGLPDDTVVVGFVGSLRKRHGVRRLAEITHVPGVRVVVIGEGPQSAWIRHSVPAAFVTGHLTGHDLSRAMASLDILVQPGTRTTRAAALREAAASGVPAVAPRAGGAPDVVRHLETGILYPPDEPAALADAVAAVRADPQRALLGSAARATALQRPWSAACDELLETMHALLGIRSEHAA